MLRSKSISATLAGSITLLAMTGCGATPRASTADPFFFPRQGGALGEGDAALLEGVAIMGDGCLLLQAADGTRYLPLWPHDTQLGMINSLPAIVAADNELLVEVGDIDPSDRVELGGSEVSEAGATELIGSLPERCAVGRCWVVSDVLTNP